MDFTKKRKAEENGNAVAATATTAASLSAEDARKLLLALTHDQLLDVLQDALVHHSDVLDAVRAVANRDTAHRKLFVRGLSADTTSDSLRSVFASFGDLDEAIVIFDKNTGKSKGYAFVTFKNADAALLALREPSKKIDGRITVTQFAAAGLSSSGGGSNNPDAGDVAARKIYVGNVTFDISSERLLSHFMMYGDIEEGPLGFDRSTGKSRGFAFFVYKTEEGARAALVDPVKSIDGHQVACKLAVDNKKPKIGVQTPVGDTATAPHPMVPGPYQGSQYGLSPVPPGNMYPGYHGGHSGGQGPPAIASSNYGLSSMGNQAPPSAPGGYGTNFAGPYSAGPPQGGEFGGRMPPSNAGYQEGSQYALGSSGIPSTQHSKLPPVGRIPQGGMYQSLHHYY